MCVREYRPDLRRATRCSTRARAIHTIGHVSRTRWTEPEGTACVTQSAISAAKSQEVARLFTHRQYGTVNHQAVPDSDTVRAA